MSKLKSFWRELLAFVSSPTFIKNFLLMVSIFGLFLLLLFVWMKFYTRHGESLQVEKYVGLHIDDARRKANSRSFNILILDSIYQHGQAANIVLQQNPPAFSRVKKNRTIYTTITRAQGDPVNLPRLTGRDEFSQYQRALSALDIKLEIKERVFNEKYAENTILALEVEGNRRNSQDLRKGVKVYPGMTVQAIVTERGTNLVPVPNLTCQKYDNALFLIQSVQLTLGTEHPDPSVTYKNDAYINRQIPSYAPGKKMRVGEQVDVFLTQTRPRNCPDLNNQTIDNSGF